MGHAKDVWGHSSIEGTKNYTIFSVGDNTEIAYAAFKGWAVDAKISFKPLLGMYRGKSEISFIINSENLARVADAGWLKGQESVLSLGTMDSQDRRAAKLIFLNEHGWPADDGDGPEWAAHKAEQDMGRFVSVSREEALNNWEDGWTYDPDQKEYFITIDPDEIKLDDEAVHKAWDALGAVRQLYVSKDEARTIIRAYKEHERRL